MKVFLFDLMFEDESKIQSEPKDFTKAITPDGSIKRYDKCLHGNTVVYFSYCWYSGWRGTRDNKTYDHCKVYKENGEWYHTSWHELTKIA